MLEAYAAHPLIANALIFCSGAFVAFIGMVLFDFLAWKRQGGGRHVSSSPHSVFDPSRRRRDRFGDQSSEIEKWWEI